MASMLGPSASMARRQIGGLVAVACAVFGGAAMVTASGVLAETGLTSHLPVDRLASADLVVSGEQSVPVVEDLDIPLPERVTVPSELVGEVGDVAGVAEAAAYFDDPERAAPGDEVDLVVVTMEPDADLDEVAASVESAMPTGVEVTTGEAIGDVESIEGGTARGELIALAASLSGTLLLLIGFIIAAALSVAVQNQRRDLALLRAVGATPRQVRRLIAAQASAAAALALPPGIALGYLMARGYASMMTGAGMLPESLPLVFGPVPGLATAFLLLVTVQLAARGAAMRASRMSATEAVAESRVEPKEPSRVRTAIGLVLLALAAAQSLMPLFMKNEAAFIASSTGTLVAIIGLALAGPAAIRAVTGLAARRLHRRTGASTWLAVSNTRAYSLRMAGSVTVLALAIGLTITQVFTQTTLERTTADQLRDGLSADAAVTGPDGLAADDAAELAEVDGVEAVVPIASTSVVASYELAGDEGAESYPAMVLGGGADRVVDPDVTGGDLAGLEGETVAVSTSAAWTWGVDVGDQIDLVLANGVDVTATVVALYDRGFGFGSVIASADLVAASGSARPFDAALVDGDAGAVAAWVEDHPGTAATTDTSMLAADSGASQEQWISLLLTLALMGYVLLGVANGLVASTSKRRSEFAALRVAGATPRQIRAMVRRETAVMVALAVTAGLLVSALPMSLLGLGLAGRPWPQGPLWVIPAAAAVGALIAWAATALPTRRALTEPPASVLASG